MTKSLYLQKERKVALKGIDLHEKIDKQLQDLIDDDQENWPNIGGSIGVLAREISGVDRI